MARAIQLEKLPIIEELPEVEEVEETEVAAVSADIDPNIDYDDDDHRGAVLVSGITQDQFFVTSSIEQKKEPEKTYLQQLKGKRVIILD